jgi:hypothetical protein
MAFLLANIPPDIRRKMGLPEDRGDMSSWVDVKDSLVNEHRILIIEQLDLDAEDQEIIDGLGGRSTRSCGQRR